MPREGVRSRWSRVPVHREAERGTGRGNLWYNKVGVGWGMGLSRSLQPVTRQKKGQNSWGSDSVSEGHCRTEWLLFAMHHGGQRLVSAWIRSQTDLRATFWGAPFETTRGNEEIFC